MAAELQPGLQLGRPRRGGRTSQTPSSDL